MTLEELFSACTAQWFRGAFAEPTEAQLRGWPSIVSGKHTLLLAPTGSGKTLAAFLAGLDRLTQLPLDAEPGVRVLYVSPMKALVYDIERNLRAPLVGLANASALAGQTSRPIRVDIRTGDTSQRDRRHQSKHPGEILVTTPESLYLLLGSQAASTLETVQTVIVDEIHVMAGSKRGVHLALSLERLSAICEREPQRVGLSATQRPLEEIARFLGGDRPVEIVDASGKPHLELEIVVPVEDMENPISAEAVALSGGEGQRQEVGGQGKGSQLATGMWPTIYPKLLALIRAHRTTIIFTNSRLLCERLTARLNELAGEELVKAHHGSISHKQRAVVEEQLKRGELPGIVATSSLELGIDMGTVDLVVLAESPGSVASGLQRVGRAGHGVGEQSIGKVFPKFRGDLLQATVVADRMLQGEVERTSVPRNCLDVLAQQVVAHVATGPTTVDELLTMVRRAYPYAELGRASLMAVLDMLSGRYPSDAFSELTPRVIWDRTTDQLETRRGAKIVAALNAGTIPDRGLYGVFLAGSGGRLGELDEEMVYESRNGDNIILGATTWKIQEITRDKVVVTPAHGEPGRLPFWRGDKPGRPLDLGVAMGAFVRELAAEKKPLSWLEERSCLDDFAARNLVAYIADQAEAGGRLPTDKCIVVERFRDELGDWRVCILSHFGSAVHAAWAMALESTFSTMAGFDVDVLYTDDGLSLRFADIEELPDMALLMPDPELVESLVVDQLGHSSLFAARFRENAGRALLLPKRRGDGRQPLWALRLRSQRLQAAASQFPAFPIILETYRECLAEVFDLDSLRWVLGAIRSREIAVHHVETLKPSPFARSLVFAYVANFLYAGDAPLAERRLAALTLDRELLRELLGSDGLRELLVDEAVEAVGQELQRLVEGRKARHADGLVDLLRRLGALTREELVERCAEEPSSWIDEMVLARRVIPIRIGGVERFAAAEDAGRYREALGVVLPAGLPSAFLDAPEDSLDSLMLRFAACHAPFEAEVLIERWGLPSGVVRSTLRAAVDAGKLLVGAFRPNGTTKEYCHPDVMRMLRQRSLAHLRGSVAPVDAPAFARFLMSWHGLGAKRQPSLSAVIDQLEGMPLVVSELWSSVLPARVPGFRPDQLDVMGAMGELVWVGRGSLGVRDGRVALYKRATVAERLAVPVVPDDLLTGTEGALRASVLEHLESRGASFFVAIRSACGDAGIDDVVSALWELVWAGLVTNDTLAPLRGLTARSKASRKAAVVGGRWSLVSGLLGDEKPTQRALATCFALMSRYGVASRAAAKAEGIAGGFSSLYPVFRELEDTARARRGWFVDGLEGAQFALPGAVDRLRAIGESEERAWSVISVTDPANAYGALVAWPPVDAARAPRRLAGTQVVLWGGSPVWLVEAKGKGWTAFQGCADEQLEEGVREWLRARSRSSAVRVANIGGEAALGHRLVAAFEAVGFVRSYKDLVLPGGTMR